MGQTPQESADPQELEEGGELMAEKTVKKTVKKSIRKTGIGDTFCANLKLICDKRHVPAENVMGYMGVCRATYYDRMKHPDRWTVSNIESAAKMFEIPVGDLMMRMLTPEEVA